jgi:hypothetical protein
LRGVTAAEDYSRAEEKPVVANDDGLFLCAAGASINRNDCLRIQFSNSEDGLSTVIASEAKQSSFVLPGAKAGLLRRKRSSQ